MFEVEATLKFCLATTGILLFLIGIAALNRSSHNRRLAGWTTAIGGGSMILAFMLKDPIYLNTMSKETTQITTTFAILALLLFAFGFPLLLKSLGRGRTTK